MLTFPFLYALLLLFALLYVKPPKSKQPNIVFIVADDLGWNDVSWHNPAMVTPNLENLAREGIILNQSYVQPMCTPSRVAFMTGYYPFRVGLQHGVIDPLKASGVPLRFSVLPQSLLGLGYKTHAVGKWHLGFCCWQYTPTYRGFQSFLGYYNGEATYYSHMTEKISTPDDTYHGYDMRNNTCVDTKCNGTYSTFVYTDAAVNIIQTHSLSSPLYLYLAYQAPHAPLQVPNQYLKLCHHIDNPARKKYCGMVAALDEGVGKVVDALKEADLYENTVIIFTTDNGGQNLYGGNNWPLRGNKATIWEGGTRGPAFVHSPLLFYKQYVSNRLIHAVDWFATLLRIGGGNVDDQIDGVDQWDAIANPDAPPARNELIYNIDNTTKYSAAIRVGDYKLIVGQAGEPSGWIPPPQVVDAQNKDDEILEMWLKETEKPPSLQLFNLRADPLEKVNLASTHPDIVSSLHQRLLDHQKQMVPSIHLPNDPLGNPDRWGGVFTPGWCDPLL